VRSPGAPVIIVGDIDRGGVLAAIYGTLALLDAADQEPIAGFVINKFRGAPELLEGGLQSSHHRLPIRSRGNRPWARPGLALGAAAWRVASMLGQGMPGGSRIVTMSAALSQGWSCSRT